MSPEGKSDRARDAPRPTIYGLRAARKRVVGLRNAPVGAVQGNKKRVAEKKKSFFFEKGRMSHD